MEWVPDVAKSKSCFNLRFVTFSCGLFSKISSIAITIVSCKGILVKRLQTYVTKVPMEEIIGRREKSSELNNMLFPYTYFRQKDFCP